MVVLSYIFTWKKTPKRMWTHKDKRVRSWSLGSIWRRKGKEVTLGWVVYHLNDFLLLVGLCRSFKSSKLTHWFRDSYYFHLKKNTRQQRSWDICLRLHSWSDRHGFAWYESSISLSLSLTGGEGWSSTVFQKGGDVLFHG